VLLTQATSEPVFSRWYPAPTSCVTLTLWVVRVATSWMPTTLAVPGRAKASFELSGLTAGADPDATRTGVPPVTGTEKMPGRPGEPAPQQPRVRYWRLRMRLDPVTGSIDRHARARDLQKAT